MSAFDSTITRTVHIVQITHVFQSGTTPFKSWCHFYEYTAANKICHLIGRLESNVNVIYREIYFYIRCTMLSVEQEQALSPAIPGHNFAVLGQARFGKTHIVKTIGERLKRAGKRVAFTCTTGIACSNYEVSYFDVSRENDIPMPYLWYKWYKFINSPIKGPQGAYTIWACITIVL